MLKAEFSHPSEVDNFCFAGATSVMDAAVEKAGTDAKEVFFSGMVGELDFEALQETAKAKGDVLFPGVMMGWATKEEAMEHLGSLGHNASGSAKKVIYHANTKVATIGGKALATHRYSAVVDSHETTDNIEMFELTEHEEPLKHKLGTSYADWSSKVEEALKEAAAAAAAAANPPAEEEKKEDGEEEKKEDGEEEKKEEWAWTS